MIYDYQVILVWLDYIMRWSGLYFFGCMDLRSGRRVILIWLWSVCLCVCVHACMRKRERERGESLGTYVCVWVCSWRWTWFSTFFAQFLLFVLLCASVSCLLKTFHKQHEITGIQSLRFKSKQVKWFLRSRLVGVNGEHYHLIFEISASWGQRWTLSPDFWDLG